MTDPFHILPDDPVEPPRFEAAVETAVARLQASAERFEALSEQVPEERFTDTEWRIVEETARAVEEAVERAEEGYVAVTFDSHAWYRIMENLDAVNLRLESAIGLLERVRDRHGEARRDAL